jgi:hypothetical protein
MKKIIPVRRGGSRVVFCSDPCPGGKYPTKGNIFLKIETG